MNTRISDITEQSGFEDSETGAIVDNDSIDILARKAADGDVKAFAQIADAYLDRIYRYVFYQVQDRKAAEEIVSEIFVKAYDNIGLFPGEGKDFATWLFNIGQSYIMSDVRFTSCIPFLEKQVAILKFIENLDNSHIANILGKEESSIREIQLRALTKLAGNDYKPPGNGLAVALDEGWQLMKDGKSTESVLGNYPAHLEKLKPLLEVAVAISAGPTASPSPQFREALRMLIIIGLRKKKIRAKKIRPRKQKQRIHSSTLLPNVMSRLAGRIKAATAKAGTTVKQYRPRLRIGYLESLQRRFKTALQPRLRHSMKVSRSVAIAITCIIMAGLAAVSIFSGALVPLFSSSDSACVLSINQGNARIMLQGEDTWQTATEGMALGAGDKIVIDTVSLATITFAEGSTSRLESGTEVTLAEAAGDGEAATAIVLEQHYGITRHTVTEMTQPDSYYEVLTPSAVVSVQGTAFMVDVDGDGNTMVQVNEGTVVVEAAGKQVNVPANHEVSVTTGQPPAEPVSLDSQDGTEDIAVTYTLTLNSSAGGSVVKPAKTVGIYPAEAGVELLAWADDGYTFVAWTGDTESIENPEDAHTTVTMNGDYSVNAGFDRLYTLTMGTTSGGSISEPGEGSHSFREGTVVDIMSMADDSHEFVAWTGDIESIDDPEDAHTTITMNGDCSVNASFGRLYSLSIDSTGGGSLIQPEEGGYTYQPDTVVKLLAVANNGYEFVAWTGDTESIDDPEDASTTITMDGDYTVEAEFVKTYDLTIRTNGGEIIMPGESTHTYRKGETVDISVEPAEGYEFVGWTGDTATIDDTGDETTTIIMNNNYSITAQFVRVYGLTVTSTSGGLVYKPGEGNYTFEEDETVQLLAVPDTGYIFVNWTGDTNTIVDTNDARTSLAMNSDYSIVANFVRTYEVSILSITSGSGGSVTKPGQGTFSCIAGTTVNLLAQPDEGYAFHNWTGDTATLGNTGVASTTIVVNQDCTIKANFVPTYTLSVSTSIGGTVIEPGEVNYTYKAGTVVPIRTEASPGYEFVAWTGDTGTIDDQDNADTTITMNGNYSITANFARLYTLTISTLGNGGVHEPGEGAFTFREGSVIDLLAVANAGDTFVNWTGDIGNVADTDNVSTTIEITGDCSVTANFTGDAPS